MMPSRLSIKRRVLDLLQRVPTLVIILTYAVIVLIICIGYLALLIHSIQTSPLLACGLGAGIIIFFLWAAYIIRTDIVAQDY